MNYRHIYHAGNFADVVKHAVLALVIERLKQKDAAFRVIDTHAGLGSYDLSADAAQRTGEWRSGIGRLLGPDVAAIPPRIVPLLAPYLDVVAGHNRAGGITRYPGSPRIARALLRPQDRLVVNELHPEDVKKLRGAFARDDLVTVMELDGWVALKAVLPPKERRGVILIDPPFEEAGELGRLISALGEAAARFATGTYLLWYPIKNHGPIRTFTRQLAATGLPKLINVEVMVRNPPAPEGLNGCGLVILNPPYLLDTALAALIPFLAERLALVGRGKWSVDWLTREPGKPSQPVRRRDPAER